MNDVNIYNIPEEILYKFQMPPVNHKTLKIWKYIIQENKKKNNKMV